MVDRPISVPKRRRTANSISNVALRSNGGRKRILAKHKPAQQSARQRAPRPMRRPADDLFSRKPVQPAVRSKNKVVRRIQVTTGSKDVEARTNRLKRTSRGGNVVAPNDGSPRQHAQLVQIWRDPVDQRQQTFPKQPDTSCIEQFPAGA
jgi:hypothetical protein